MKAAMRTWWVVALSGLGCAQVVAQNGGSGGYSFTVLESSEPDVPTSRGVMAHAISGDGHVVAGGSALWELPTGEITERPYVWIRQQDGVWQRKSLPMLGFMPDESQLAGRPTAISFDGSVIAGMVGPRVFSQSWNYGTAAKWTDIDTDTPIVTRILPETLSSFRSYACGMSRTGDKILTFIQPVSFHGDRTLAIASNDGIEFAVESGDHGATSALLFNGNGLSSDGHIIAFTDMSTFQPFKWSFASGIEQLPVDASLPFDQRCGLAWAVSPDGSTLGGWVGELDGTFNEPNRYGAIWTSSGLTRLPSLFRRIGPPQPFTARFAIVTTLSEHGEVIGGVLNAYYPYNLSLSQTAYSTARCVLWVNRRLFLLDDILLRQGVDLQGVMPRWISDISYDGSTIAGWGTRLPQDAIDVEYVSFVATILPPGTCDDIDFNRDGSRFDPLDIDAFLSVYSEGPCVPAGAQCRDLDFNNDGSLFDPEDINAFLRVFAEGPCVE